MPGSLQAAHSRPGSARWAALLAYVAGFFILLVAILRHTDGHFFYSLDDPYIHLALAERIRHGLYGLNAGEVASPSSSILWPFLFVPFAGTTLMSYLPLCLNFILGSSVAWLLGSVVDRFMPGAHTAAGLNRWLHWAAAVLLLLGVNVLGLTFTGLEQLLELLLCIACAFLCIRAAERRHIPTWTIVAAALLPGVRYEGVLVMSAAAVVLWCAGRRRAAAWTVVLGLLPLGLFSLFLLHLGLPPVPISVAVKGATVVVTGGKVHGLLLIGKGAVKTAFHEPERAVVLALTILSLILLPLRFAQRELRPLLFAVSAVGVVQTLIGPFGWLFRYEIYSIGFMLPVLLACLLGGQGRSVQPTEPRTPGVIAIACSGMLVALCALVYSPALYATVNAAQSVWREQAQLARLTHDYYRGPVAINDLGLVSYGRDPHNDVLDLYALGSPEVYRMLVKRTLWSHLGDLTAEHHIGLVAVYPEWIKSTPEEWHPIAKLCSSDVVYGPAFSRVMFYSTPETDLPAMLDTLRRFRSTLPAGSAMELEPKDTSLVCAAGE